MANSTRLPTERQIRAYWAKQGIWKRKDYDSAQEFMEKGICMACGWGKPKGLQRAHITPRTKQGPDTPENIHMLCYYCHTVSEVLEGDAYWHWFYAMNQVTALFAWAVASGSLTFAELFAATKEDTIMHRMILMDKYS